MRTRTSPGPGCGGSTSSSRSTSGPPNARTRMAFMAVRVTCGKQAARRLAPEGWATWAGRAGQSSRAWHVRGTRRVRRPPAGSGQPSARRRTSGTVWSAALSLLAGSAVPAAAQQPVEETVVVTATVSPEPFGTIGRALVLITRDEIDRLPVSSVADVLRLVSSVEVRARGPAASNRTSSFAARRSARRWCWSTVSA